MQNRNSKDILRLILRLLLLFVLVVGLAVRYWVLPALDQKRIAQWVAEQQGNVAYQEELIAAEKYSDAQYGWVAKILGLDFVDRIASVSLNTTDDMTQISQLPYLQHLSIGNYTGSSLLGLEQMVNLESLTISESGVVDLVAVQNLRNLSYLGFTNSNTKDFYSLQYMTSLTYLDLYGTRMDSLADLGNLTQLEWLFMPSFEGQAVDISPLKKLVKLRQLCLDAKSVTEAQVADLKAALPNCHVEFYPSSD